MPDTTIPKDAQPRAIKATTNGTTRVKVISPQEDEIIVVYFLNAQNNTGNTRNLVAFWYDGTDAIRVSFSPTSLNTLNFFQHLGTVRQDFAPVVLSKTTHEFQIALTDTGAEPIVIFYYILPKAG